MKRSLSLTCHPKNYAFLLFRLEVQLPIVFEALNEIYRSFDARLKAEQFRRQIANVLAVWENWIVFPQTYIDNLATVLTRKDVNATADSASPSAISEESSSSFQPVAKGLSSFAPVDATSTHTKDEDIDGVPIEDEDLDGVPMDDGEDLDGMPMNEDEDLDGVPMDDDLDGVPMNENEDLDGVPMDDDIDGVPM